MFRNPDNFSKISIPVSSDNGQNIDLILPAKEGYGEVVVKLENCCSQGELRDEYKDQMNYLSRLLWLFAGMCSGKNYVNFTSVSVWFTKKLLLFNMWNENLSVSLRAGFCRLFKSMYVDCFSKIESKRIETVKILQINDMKRVRTQKLMKIDLNKDFKEVIKKILHDNEKEQEEKDEYGMNELIEKINNHIEYYLIEGKSNELDNLLLELLNIVFKLIKLEIIGLSGHNQQGEYFEGPFSKNFSYENTSLFYILKNLIKILFKDLLFSSNDQGIRKPESSAKIVNQDKEIILLNERDAYKNEIVSIEGEHLLNYFKSVCSFERNKKDMSTCAVECKIKILKILDYILDWIIDSHVMTVIDIFQTNYNSNKQVSNYSINDIESMIPDIFITNTRENSENSSLKTFHRNY